MSKHDLEVSIAERREVLERRANVIRKRLLRTIDVLDVRRHQVTVIGHQVKRLAVPVAAVAFGFALLAAGTTFAIGRAARKKKDRMLSVRLQKWLAPMIQPPKPSLLEDVIRRVTLIVVSTAGTELARRALAPRTIT